MLNNYVIHLKNVIFFKFVFYIFAVIISLYLIIINKNQLSLAQHQNRLAEKSFNEAAIKLYSIIDSDSKILDTFKRYEQIVDKSPEDGCNYRNNLIASLLNLAKKYNLSEPITLNINQFFDRNNLTIGNNGKIHIRSYEISLSFAVFDYLTYLSIIQDAYNLLPENSVLVSTEAELNEWLNPAIIKKLSTAKMPNLISSNLVFHIREIAVK